MSDTDRQGAAIAAFPIAAAPPSVRIRLRERFAALPLTWKVVTVLVALEAVLVLLHGANKLALGDGHFLALDAEKNLPTWFSSSIFCLAAASWLLLAAHRREEGGRFFAAIGLLLLALSLDEAAEIHDRVEDMADFRVAVLGWEPLLAVLVIWLFVRAYRQLGPRSRLLVLCGAACLGGAQFVSALNGTVDFFYLGEVGLGVAEEWLEMLTATFLLGAAIDALRDAIAAYSRSASARAALDRVQKEIPPMRERSDALRQPPQSRQPAV
jgi:hypothetical protein